MTRVAFPEKESWGGLSFYTVRALGFGLQIIVYSQADHVAFTILDANLNFLQRFYRASLGTPSAWSQGSELYFADTLIPSTLEHCVLVKWTFLL